jgi:hypothetical protein
MLSPSTVDDWQVADVTAAVSPTLMAHTPTGAYEPAAATVIDPVSPSSGWPAVIGVRLTSVAKLLFHLASERRDVLTALR